MANTLLKGMELLHSEPTHAPQQSLCLTWHGARHLHQAPTDADKNGNLNAKHQICMLYVCTEDLVISR